MAVKICNKTVRVINFKLEGMLNVRKWEINEERAVKEKENYRHRNDTILCNMCYRRLLRRWKMMCAKLVIRRRKLRRMIMAMKNDFQMRMFPSHSSLSDYENGGAKEGAGVWQNTHCLDSCLIIFAP